MTGTDQSGDRIFRCGKCDEELGSVKLAYVSEDYGMTCECCAPLTEILAVAEVENWRDRPMGGNLIRQEIAGLKPVDGIRGVQV